MLAGLESIFQEVARLRDAGQLDVRSMGEFVPQEETTKEIEEETCVSMRSR